MYQALYRKYRPKRIDDIVGQEVVLKIIKNSLINNMISHAYVFYGPRGTGKTTMAKLLAKYVNCLNLKKHECCNECKNCLEIDNNQSMDILEIDAASNNGVEEIRELRSKVNLISNSLKYKIYIIDEVHMLTAGAFNALLKTLEEPPKNVIFILATTDIQKLPSTILSRCQILNFNKITEKHIKDNLIKICKSEKISITDDAANEIARCSDGGMRDAIGLLDKIISYGRRTIVLEDVSLINGILSLSEVNEFIDYIFNNDIKSVLNKLNLYDEQGKSLEKLIEDIINLITIDLQNSLMNEGITKYDENKSLLLLETLNTIVYNMKNVNSSKLLLEIELIKFIKNTEIISREIISEDLTNDRQLTKQVKAEEKEPRLEENFKSIRVNNALAEASKELLNEVNKKISNIINHKYDSKYSNVMNILKDGRVRVASKTHIIISFPYASLVDKAYDNIIDIEDFFKKELELKLKTAFIDNQLWTKIKKEYINKKQNGITYTLIEETPISKLIKSKKNTNKTMNNDDKEVIALLGEEFIEIK
ncbi:MAG: DNA polymerase III subunit gamma/tau [Tenericutes bacterium]|nr:DNA polymerase III subunit gamma/tau [Mycoplasmatota bacterium]